MIKEKENLNILHSKERGIKNTIFGLESEVRDIDSKMKPFKESADKYNKLMRIYKNYTEYEHIRKEVDRLEESRYLIEKQINMKIEFNYIFTSRYSFNEMEVHEVHEVQEVHLDSIIISSNEGNIAISYNSISYKENEEDWDKKVFYYIQTDVSKSEGVRTLQSLFSVENVKVATIQGKKAIQAIFIPIENKFAVIYVDTKDLFIDYMGVYINKENDERINGLSLNMINNRFI